MPLAFLKWPTCTFAGDSGSGPVLRPHRDHTARAFYGLWAPCAVVGREPEGPPLVAVRVDHDVPVDVRQKGRLAVAGPLLYQHGLEALCQPERAAAMAKSRASSPCW